MKKYSKHPSRCDLTPTTRYLSQTNIVIDKMHMVGHVDSWCKKECDPHLYPDLNKVSKLVYTYVTWFAKTQHNIFREIPLLNIQATIASRVVLYCS